ncbi:MAG: M15 family metallopeptidase [Tenericutes bacterium]|nr:M15 family metallopeptidase [Mycoplasmatota bacterium]
MKKFIKFIIIIFIVGFLFFLWKELDKGETKIKEPSLFEKKLLELDNINKKIDYFNDNYIDRYIAYKNNNPDESLENIITHVNIGIDQPFFTNIKEAVYLNQLYIMTNKYIKLPNDYVPNNLRELKLSYSIGGMFLVEEAADAFESMASKAKTEGYTIRAMSTYRSYSRQEGLYNQYVKEIGVEATDKDTARPGHSEHQTGLTVDVDNSKISYSNFENTKEFEWMKKNAYKYGFILRYPEGKEFITGYIYESWHYRYVGLDIANYIHNHNITFDEYYVKFIEGKK